MISVEEALRRILATINLLEIEEKPVLDALGQVVAEDVVSNIDIPPLDNTAMDGYAVRAADTDDASEQSPSRSASSASWPQATSSAARWNRAPPSES